MIRIRKENERYPYYEMARVGITGSNIEIFVRTDDPGKVPHFHFIDRNAKKNREGCIRIDKPEYFDHGYKNKHLNSKQIRELIEFLNGPTDDPDIPLTNWRYLISMWNKNNSDVMIDRATPMPDYTELIGV